MAVAQGGLYYRTGRDDSDHGPVGQQELEELVKQGSVTRNTEVRRDGSSVWIRLGRFLNIPESQLPEQQALSEPEWSRLIDEFVIDSGKPEPKPSAPKVDRWSCRIYGKEVGPMEVPLLRTMAEQGQIAPTDRVRREGEAKWMLADSIPGLFDGLNLTPKDSGARPLLGISPQRFGKIVPKAKKKKKRPPQPPAEAKSVPTKPAAQPAAAAGSKPDSTNPSAAPASTPSSPPSGAAPSASPGTSTSSPPTASSTPPTPPRPSISAAPPTTSGFAGAAASSYQKPAFKPPPRSSRKPKRDWSFEMPEMGGMDFKQMVIGFFVFVLVIGVWWAVGGLSLLKGLIFE